MIALPSFLISRGCVAVSFCSGPKSKVVECNNKDACHLVFFSGAYVTGIYFNQILLFQEHEMAVVTILFDTFTPIRNHL